MGVVGLAASLAEVGRHWRRGESVTSVHGVEVAYFCILASLTVVGWLTLLLGEIGRVSIGAVGSLAVLVGTAVYLAYRRARSRWSITWSLDMLGVLPALLLAAALFIPPFEYIRGALDPGVYVNTAANIARTGSIVIVDREMAALSPQARASLFRDPPGVPANAGRTYAGRLVGFYIADVDRGVVVPHGFHLYPTLLAIAYLLGGIWAVLWATPAVAALGLVGFYLVTRRLFGGAVAALAAVLLAANPGEIWFAHYPAAENLVQMLLFGGLLAFITMLDTRSRWLAVLAGLSLGAVHLTKIEAVALPLALGAFFAYRWITRDLRAEHGYFLAAYGLVLSHAVLHALLISRWYTYDVVTQSVGPTSLAVAAALVALGLLDLTAGRSWTARVLASPLWRGFAAPAAVAGILLLAAFAYYVRPRIGGQVASLGTPMTEATYNLMNSLSFPILSWYVSPLGLLLGTLGYAVALTRRASARTAVVLLLSFLETVLYMSNGRITPVHFWAARRYLPVIFPAFALFSAYLLWRLQVALRNRWPEALLPGALGVVMLASSLGGWLPFLGHVEYRGAVTQMESLARLIPEDGIVLFDDSDVGQRLSAPLQFIWGRTSFVLWQTAEEGTADRLISEWLTRGRSVYWVRSADEPGPSILGYREELVGSLVIDQPEVVATVYQRPNTIGEFRVQICVYQVLPES